MNKTLSVVLLSPLLLVLALCSGCATTGKTPAQQRQIILDMKNEVLADLYKVKPDVRAQIQSAPGYAVFTNANLNVVLASFGGGYGVVRNNQSGRYTYMKMGEVGLGVGMGVKDFRVVFVFHDLASLTRFIDHGWAFGAQADAAVKASDKGVAVAGEATVDNISVYQLTENGLALQATLKGSKYWQDPNLN